MERSGTALFSINIQHFQHDLLIMLLIIGELDVQMSTRNRDGDSFVPQCVVKECI